MARKRQIKRKEPAPATPAEEPASMVPVEETAPAAPAEDQLKDKKTVKLHVTISLNEPSAFSIRRAMAGRLLFNDGPAMRCIMTDPKKPITVTITQE